MNNTSKLMQPVKLKSAAEIEEMRAGGRISAEIVDKLAQSTVADMPAKELDDLARSLCKQYGVTSGTVGYQGYPSAVSVSINDELVHGIPVADRIIRAGDLVSIDMVIIYRDWYLDHAVTVSVGEIGKQAQTLMKITELANNQAISQFQIGNHVGDISNRIQSVVELAGFNVSRQMIGHGIGRDMHELPEVPCFGAKGRGIELKPGMVLAIETMSMVGDPDLIIDADDKWTARTRDGSLSCHFEHTVALTSSGPQILTQNM